MDGAHAFAFDGRRGVPVAPVGVPPTVGALLAFEGFDALLDLVVAEEWAGDVVRVDGQVQWGVGVVGGAGVEVDGGADHGDQVFQGGLCPVPVGHVLQEAADADGLVWIGPTQGVDPLPAIGGGLVPPGVGDESKINGTAYR